MKKWSHLCLKSGGVKIKCTTCPQHDFVPYNAEAVEQHLRGKKTIGVYPMSAGDTCRFLVFDFDAKGGYSQEDLLRDVTLIRKICEEKNIDMAVERSRSGKGIHFGFSFLRKYLQVWLENSAVA